MIEFKPTRNTPQVDISKACSTLSSFAKGIQNHIRLLQYAEKAILLYLEDFGIQVSVLRPAYETMLSLLFPALSIAGGEDPEEQLIMGKDEPIVFASDDGLYRAEVYMEQQGDGSGEGPEFLVTLKKREGDDLYIFDIELKDWDLVERDAFREIHEAMGPVSEALDRNPTREEEKDILSRHEKLIQLHDMPELRGLLEYDVMDVSNMDASTTELILVPADERCCGLMIRCDGDKLQLCQDILASDLYGLYAATYGEDVGGRLADRVKERALCVFKGGHVMEFAFPLRGMLDHNYTADPTMIFPLTKREFLVMEPGDGEIKVSANRTEDELSIAAKKNRGILLDCLNLERGKE